MLPHHHGDALGVEKAAIVIEEDEFDQIDRALLSGRSRGSGLLVGGLA
jgi:hypothetical protein